MTTHIDFFPWNEFFNIGLPEIDAQHRRLVGLINKLADAIANDTQCVDLDGVFAELLDYADYHFKTEDAMWQRYLSGSHDARDHYRSHTDFIEETMERRKNQDTADAGQPCKLANEMLTYLTRWLTAHILKADRYMAYIVLGIQSGLDIPAARAQARRQMTTATQLLTEIILDIFSRMAASNLQLKQEIVARGKTDATLTIVNERFRYAMQGANDGIWEMNLETGAMYYSPRFIDMLGYPLDTFPQNLPALMQLMHSDDRASAQVLLDAYLAGHSPGYANEIRFLHHDGHWLWILCRARLACDDAGNVLQPRRLVGTHTDITRRKRVELDLARREKEWRTLVENTPSSIARYDPRCQLIFCNSAYNTVFDSEGAEALGKRPAENPGGEAMIALEAKLREVFKTGEKTSVELHWTTAKRHDVHTALVLAPEYDMAGSEIESILCVGRDITEEFRQRQQIQQMAYYDELTGLPNRRMLLLRLQQALAVCKRRQSFGALLFIDLDHFKTINDTLGHATGDRLLQAMANRLVSCVRESDTVARMGGDEFVILLEDLHGSGDEISAQARTISEKLLTAMRQPCQLDTTTYVSSGSMGITLFAPDDPLNTAEELLKQADIAMYQAKNKTRGTACLFTPQ